MGFTERLFILWGENIMILYIGFIIMLVILIIYQHEEIKILEEIIKEMGGTHTP